MLPGWARVLIGYPVLQFKLQALDRFRRKLVGVAAVQEERLQSMLRLTAGSAFAKDFGLDRVKTVAEFRRALPVAGYERMAPYVDRVKAGEVTALFRAGTRILMFATTSGTTAAMKSIPVTTASLDEYRDSWTVFGLAVAKQYPHLPYAGVIQLASNWRVGTTPSGVPTGSITGLLFERMHNMMRFSHVAPPAVSALTDSAMRYYLTLRLGLQRRDTAVINAANPSTLLTLARRLDEQKEDLIRDVHDGTLKDAKTYPAAIQRRLTYMLKADPATARALDAVVLRTGHLYPKDAWNLTLLCVWTGGTLSSYLKQLPEYYGDLPRRDHGLSASEARMTIPLQNDVPYGVLNVAGSFYEFIPEAEYGRPDPRTLLGHELEVGASYYVVLTTSGGLFRYDIADVVRCEGFEAEAPLLTFLNKGSQIANLTGEKLSAYQVTQAVSAVQKRLDVYLGEYVVAPAFADPPGYHLLIEAARFPAEDLAAQVERLVEDELMRTNVEYAEKRNSGRLEPLILTPARDGSFRELRQRRLDAGTPPEQYKHPFLIPSLEFVPQVALGVSGRRRAGHGRRTS